MHAKLCILKWQDTYLQCFRSVNIFLSNQDLNLRIRNPDLPDLDPGDKLITGIDLASSRSGFYLDMFVGL
jgi:hypothetical protein